MSNKALLIILLTALSFVSCKKAVQLNAPAGNNGGNYQSLVLQPLQTSGNLVTLNWTKLDTSEVSSYHIVRCTDTMDASAYSNTIIVTKNTNEYVDTLPLGQYVQYYIMAELYNTNYGSQEMSNRQTCVRTDLNILLMNPSNALYDKTSHYLYVFGTNNNIMLYDVFNKKSLQQISTNATMGYCDVGTYNGTRELYVPRSDGWLFIYDATTLNKIDQINVTGNLSGVVYNNGILYISYSTSYYSYVGSYSRSTKAQISPGSGTYFGGAHLKTIPGTNSNFIGIVNQANQALNISFDATGKYDTTKSLFENNYAVSSQTFALYADGSSFISGGNGDIYNMDLSHKVTLPHGNLGFTFYDLDDAGRMIYASVYNNKMIQGYSMDNYQLSKTINTQGYPFAVFYDNGSVICLSIFNPQQQNNSLNPYCFVEKF